MASHQCSIFSAYLILLICPVKNGGITDTVPGTLLTSTGEAYASGSDLLIALDSHKSGSNVPVIVVDRGCVLNRAGLIGTDATAVANAISQIEAAGLNRVSE